MSDKLSPKDFLAAAASGDVETVKSALAAGTPADTWDEHGNTALMMASARGQKSVVEALIAAGADPSHTNKFGLGARQWVEWADNDAPIRSLLG